MGFFKKKLTRTLAIRPALLGANLRAHIKAQAAAEATEGGMGDAGMVITVLRIPDEGIVMGAIDHLTGDVRAVVTFDAICFKPLRNEVLDGVVSDCNNYGIFVEVGPFSVLVHKHFIPGDLKFRAEDLSYVSDEGGPPVKVGSSLRLRVTAVNPLDRNVGCLGTIDEPFLGGAARRRAARSGRERRARSPTPRRAGGAARILTPRPPFPQSPVIA